MQDEPVPEALDDHAKAVWAAKILAAHKHRESDRWIVLTTEEFSIAHESCKIEVIPKECLTTSGLLSGWTAAEAYAIAQSYVR